jgi:O-antigen/teichoic acid export membrane protein
LILLQLASYGIPLVTVPYLSRVFGVSTFGLVAVVTNLSAYAALVIEWGANLGVTQQVAQRRQEPGALAELFWTTMTARCCLAGILLLLLTVMLLSHRIPIPGRLLGALALSIVAVALSTDWFLQGLERMGVLTASTLTARLAAVPLTFLLIHSPSDAWVAVALNGATSLVAAGYTLSVAFSACNLGLPRWRPRSAFHQLVAQRHLFVSRASIAVYTASTPILLGLVAGPYAVGLYAGAEKILRVPLQLLNQISSAVFPRLNALHGAKGYDAAAATRKVMMVQVGAGACVSALLFIGAPVAVALLLGREFSGAGDVLRILSPLPVLIALSNVAGVQSMIMLGMTRTFSAVTVVSAAVYAILVLLLGRWFSAHGAAAAQTITEAGVVILMIVLLARREPAFSARVFMSIPGTGPKKAKGE